MKSGGLVFALFVVACRSTLGGPVPEMPTFLKICHRSDPKLNSCIKESINSMKPYLKNGIPALDVPPCEPLRIPRIEISQAAGPVSVSSTYTDIDIFGGTDFVFKSVKADVEKNRMRLKLFIPRLEMISRYNLEGKILMLPITGNGVARGNYTDIDVVSRFQVERYVNQVTNQLHYRVSDFYMDFDIGHVNLHLDNLFNGDEALSDAMNLFLNDNWKTVVAEIKPALEDTIADLFKSFANKIFAKYPADVLLPP